MAFVNIAFVFSLLPTIFGDDKPHRATALMTSILLYVAAYTMSTLGLKLTAGAMVATGSEWALIFVQSWSIRQRSESVVKRRRHRHMDKIRSYGEYLEVEGDCLRKAQKYCRYRLSFLFTFCKNRRSIFCNSRNRRNEKEYSTTIYQGIEDEHIHTGKAGPSQD